jgi:ATP-dependent DNA helicase RecG
MLTLDTKIKELYSVGKTVASRLTNLGIVTAKDLLYYFPFRYDDFQNSATIAKLKPGISANIIGIIDMIQNKKTPRKRMNITEALINDGSDTIKAIWFNQPFITKTLHEGDTVSLAGKIEDDKFGTFQIKSPAYEKIQGSLTNAIHTKGLIPNYHLTANITQKQLRFLLKQVIELSKILPDFLPDDIVKNNKLISHSQAIRQIHFPKKEIEIDEAKKRLAFEELFLLQLQSVLSQKKLSEAKAQSIKFKENEIKKFIAGLPFELTASQKKSAWEIVQDMRGDIPMSRLLEGDVGSGKTIVVVIAMLNTALNGYQSVIMVPTEILAFQHYESIKKLLDGFGIDIALVTRSRKETNSQSHNAQRITHNASIIIGTHALIQDKVEFNNLALAIIDEQHRFGVEQRQKLTEKSGNNKTSPHFLSMTATPIPRTMALALYGDLKLSIINELPKGRQKISTFVVPEKKRLDGYKFIEKEIKKGRQAFVICPLIDVSDKLGFKSVKEEYKKLNTKIFPHLNIAFLHGKLKSEEKEKIMQNFLKNKINILISTSVVEVGVDVPNATIMMIEGADRFGLAQLHQFRGRVGRSEHKSYCFLFSESASEKTRERLSAMTKYHSGFDLAKIDLELRGAGEVYGLAQKGFPELKIANLYDYKLMKNAREEAENILKTDPNLNKYPLIKEKINLNKAFHLE